MTSSALGGYLECDSKSLILLSGLQSRLMFIPTPHVRFPYQARESHFIPKGKLNFTDFTLSGPF